MEELRKDFFKRFEEANITVQDMEYVKRVIKILDKEIKSLKTKHKENLPHFQTFC